MTSTPLRVLVAGGGVAGIEALLTLHALAGDRVELTLADAQPEFIDRPMTVAEPFARGQARHYPLADIALLTFLAQRISTIMNADQILVLEDGRNVGLGTHRDLLETCPTYAEIVASQAGVQDAA